jgi:hypothetical protein
MVDNSINRYKIGSADNLTVADDGSTTLHIQAESPGKEHEGNRPPKGPFYMLFRMYLPDIQILNGLYHLPESNHRPPPEPRHPATTLANVDQSTDLVTPAPPQVITS